MATKSTVRAGRFEVLLVEDNSGDVRIIHEALKESGVDVGLSVVSDGVEALAFLRREDPYQDSRRPDLILLDLNMPNKDGREVLVEVKSDPSLGSIPIVVLTSAASAKDVSWAYGSGANSFVAKPVDFEEFARRIGETVRYWTSVASLPPRTP